MKLDTIIEKILNTGRMLETGMLWRDAATNDIKALLKEYDTLKNIESSSRIIICSQEGCNSPVSENPDKLCVNHNYLKNIGGY